MACPHPCHGAEPPHPGETLAPPTAADSLGASAVLEVGQVVPDGAEAGQDLGGKKGLRPDGPPRDTHPHAGCRAVSPPPVVTTPTWANGVTIMSSPCLREQREHEPQGGDWGSPGAQGWGATLTGRWRWRSCGTWLLGTGRSRCQSGRGRTRGAGRGRRCLAGPAPRPGWPGGPSRPGPGGHSPGQSCEGRGDKPGTGWVVWGPQPTGVGTQAGGCHQVCWALRATIPLSPARPGSVALAVTPAAAQPGPVFTPALRTGTTQGTQVPSAPCQCTGGWNWGHRLLLPVHPLPVPSTIVPSCLESPRKPKASIDPSSGRCVPREGQRPGHSTEPGDIEGQKPLGKPSPGPQRDTGGSLGTPQPEPPGSHAGPWGYKGHGDRHGDPVVPGVAASASPAPRPAPLAPGSWERLHAGTLREPPSACPLLQLPPPREREQVTAEHWVNWESAGAIGATPSPWPSTYPMHECLRDGHRLPGSISPLWQHHRQPRRPRCGRPRQRQPGTTSRHPAAPCFPASASCRRWYRGHKAALWLRRPRG